eukprot:11172475-Lingulodinium_polyedra.AAC.1
MRRRGTSVVWLNHGGNVIRGTPEHLRHATDAERALFEHQHGTMDLLTDRRTNSSRTWDHRLHPRNATPRKETMDR